MSTDPTSNAGARMLSEGAHELRNHVATIRSVVRLVDDAEIADALDEASRAVLVAVERAIVMSRVDLGERPVLVALEIGTLFDLAARPARREGADVTHIDPDSSDGSVTMPGPWAERLIADLLHRSARPPVVTASGGAVIVNVSLGEPMLDALGAGLERLARACGGTLALQDLTAALRFPLAPTISAE